MDDPANPTTADTAKRVAHKAPYDHLKTLLAASEAFRRLDAQRAADIARANALPQLAVQVAADIDPQPVEWLWPGRIALGKLTLIAGLPGLGKSQLTAFLTAAVSNNRP